MKYWIRRSWPLRALVGVVAVTWLSWNGRTLGWADRLWFDEALRRAAPYRSPVYDNIFHVDVDTAELDRWQSSLGEHAGLAELIDDIRANGASLIVLDLVLKSGTPPMFAPFWKRTDSTDDLVLGRTWDDRTRLKPGASELPPEGMLYIDVDPDGLSRRYTLAHRDGDHVEPSLALAAYLALQRIPWSPAMLQRDQLQFTDYDEQGNEVRRVLPNQIYLDQRASWTDRSPRNFHHLTPAELRAARTTAHTDPKLEGAVVFIGYTAPGAGDIGATALNTHTPRVALHSLALNDLRQNSWHTVPRIRTNLLVLICTLTVAWAIGAHLSGRFFFILSLLGTLALQGLALQVLLRTHLVPAAMSITGFWWVGLLQERLRIAYLREERAREFQDLANVEDPLLLKRVGQYELVERIGQGGFAAVYRAVPLDDLDPARSVAVKIVHPAAASSEDFRRRFLREIRISSQLHHPCIVRVLDSGDRNGLLFLIMELVRGRSLRQLLDERRANEEKWNVAQVGMVIDRVLQGMTYAHEQNVLHRDLKPENIMVDEALTQVKIVDFGLAFDSQSSQLTRTGEVFGTLDYLSPERVQGQGDDPRSDLYAVGVIAYEMLAGKNPFPSMTAGEAIMFRLSQDPESLKTFRPDLTPELIGVIEKMMAREVEQRYPDSKTALAAWRSVTVGNA